MLVLLQIIPPDEDNSVENSMADCFGHMTRMDQSESIKTNTDHVTHKGKYKLTNQKPCNFAHELLLDEVIR